MDGSNLTNVTNTFPAKITTEDPEIGNISVKVSFIITIVINSITCPFTVLLNVLVIMAVKRRPRLQSNTNMLLACLAATDFLTGLILQPLFISWKSLYLLNTVNTRIVTGCHNLWFRVVSVSSSLHLMLVTCERLTAIRFTANYPYIVTKQNIKVAMIIIWSFSLLTELARVISHAVTKYMNLLVSLAIILCIIFIASAYVVLYRETRRHEENIKAKQLPQEEVARFAKESKALKTTVLVASSVILCFLPFGSILLTVVTGLNRKIGTDVMYVLSTIFRTLAMLSSLLNPVIYCLRQKEMRRFILRLPCKAVEPVNV